jgi:hypothetical protein
MTAERAAKLEALGFCWGASNSRGPDEVAWGAQLARLVAYKTAHGDCKVPRGWTEDPRLGQWVGNQRARKRKLDRGEPSEGMTAERAAKLEALGFCWGASNLGRRASWGSPSTKVRSRGRVHGAAQGVAWEAQLARLAVYKAVHGDCKVPRGWAEDPRLGVWVANQRQRKKKLDRGAPSEGLTAERVARLEALGVWSRRG